MQKHYKIISNKINDIFQMEKDYIWTDDINFKLVFIHKKKYYNNYT